MLFPYLPSHLCKQPCAPSPALPDMFLGFLVWPWFWLATLCLSDDQRPSKALFCSPFCVCCRIAPCWWGHCLCLCFGHPCLPISPLSWRSIIPAALGSAMTRKMKMKHVNTEQPLVAGEVIFVSWGRNGWGVWALINKYRQNENFKKTQVTMNSTWK